MGLRLSRMLAAGLDTAIGGIIEHCEGVLATEQNKSDFHPADDSNAFISDDYTRVSARHSLAVASSSLRSVAPRAMVMHDTKSLPLMFSGMCSI